MASLHDSVKFKETVYAAIVNAECRRATAA